MRSRFIYPFYLCVFLSFATSAAVSQDVALHQLTEESAESRYPSWSPDGNFLVFETNRNGNWDIYMLRMSDRTVAPLTKDPADDRYPSWDPSGRRLLFQSDRGGTPNLYVLDLSTRKAQLLADIDGVERYPVWSPDGSQIVFSMQVDSISQIVSLDQSGQTRIIAPSPFRSVWPRWSPITSDIVFFSRRDSEGVDDDLYLLSVATGTMRRLTDRVGHDFVPDWSPDGERIVSVGIEVDGSRSLYFTPIGEGSTRVLRTSFFRLTEPAWSPDGKFLALAGKEASTDDYQLYVVQIEE